MNKILITSIVSILFLISFSYSSSIFAQEDHSSETMGPVLEMEHSIEILVGVAHWLTGIGTIVLAIALIRTFKHMEAVTQMTSIETEYRLRPWIAPIGPITKMEKSISDDCQFDITIKNFGELAASNVTAKFVKGSEPFTRESLQSDPGNSYDLGPLMPTMEKHFWFFIDSELWKKVDAGSEPLHTGLYFEYDTAGKKSGYGMLSEYNPTAKNFIHKDMWIDN
jgi:hypothetical protein